MCIVRALAGITITFAVATFTGLAIASTVAAAIAAAIAVAAASPVLTLSAIGPGRPRIYRCRHDDRSGLGNVAAGKERDDPIPHAL